MSKKETARGVIMWTKLSEALTGSRFKIRKNYAPKTYKKDVEQLVNEADKLIQKYNNN